MRLRRFALLAAATLAGASAAAAQSPVLLQLESGSPLGNRFVVDSSGAFVAHGFVRDVGNTTGCAAQRRITSATRRRARRPSLR